MLRSAPVDLELSQRIYWLIQLRWLAASAVIYGTFVAAAVAGVGLDALPLYLLGGGIAIYNSLFIVALKWVEVISGAGRLRHARLMANLQIVVDLVFLTLVVHFSGGVENPLSFYYIFHVIIASILLSRRETFVQATVANVLFASMVLAEYAGLVPHVHVYGPFQPNLSRDTLFVLSTLLVFGSTLYLAAYMATSIVGRLRQRDREIMDLTSELERKARELEGAYNRLTELERVKSQHMRKVSHEIRAPLAAIQSSLKVVLDGLTGDVPPKQREMIARAERRTHGLLSLVADLLILSRAREARLFTERRRVAPADVVEKVVALHAPRARSRDIALSSRVVGEIPEVLADPEALEQLFTNLVANAVNYTPGGGKVEATTDSVGNAVRFQVRDTGIGIAATDLPKIFGEFFRAENARRFSEEGTGLGLSIVRSIVETHGGEITVESEVGTGTTFTVLLPAATEHLAQPEGDLEERPAGAPVAK